MAERNMRLQMIRSADQSQELSNFRMKNATHEYPDVDDRDPLRWTKDKEYRDTILRRGPGSVNVLRSKSEAEKGIERKMSTPVSVNFKSTSLEAVIEHLQTMTAINFDLDLRGLKEGNVDPKQSITANLKDVSLLEQVEVGKVGLPFESRPGRLIVKPPSWRFDLRIEEDLIDQLFNSSEKRLARTLLLLARYGKPDKPVREVPPISQETLAEMVGTTRSRVNFFMKKFERLGFITYKDTLKVNNSLLTVILHD
jgi:hypothetical protein